MFGLDASRIPYHIENGTIPAPIQGVEFRGQRKSSKAIIDKFLGIDDTRLSISESRIRDIVAQELRKLVAIYNG